MKAIDEKDLEDVTGGSFIGGMPDSVPTLEEQYLNKRILYAGWYWRVTKLAYSDGNGVYSTNFPVHLKKEGADEEKIIMWDEFELYLNTLTD